MNSPMDQVRDVVAGYLEEDGANLVETENLFEAGLDSIHLMQIVNLLRRAGVPVDFAALSLEPTLLAWTALITGSAEATTGSTADATAPTAEDPAGDGSAGLGVMQHAYWAGRGPDQRLGGVAAHLYIEFDRDRPGSTVEPEPLRHAIGLLIARHETLRSQVTPDGRQRVLPAGIPPLTVYDLRGEEPERIEAHLEQLRDTFSHQSLDIERGEVFAIALTRLPGGATRLHVDVDMIAADAVSYRILLADLAALYREPERPPPAPSLRYRDHLNTEDPAAAQRARRAADAWRDRLPTLPGGPVLPEVVPAAGQPPRVTRRHVWLAEERAAALSAASRRYGVTPAMAVAAALSEVLGRWSTTDHFLLNVPMFDRPARPGIEQVVGDFSSSVMLEVDLREPVPFVERVRQLQQRMHTDAAHGAYTGLDVLRELSRLRGEQVLAPVVFTSALGLGELFAPEVTECFGQPVWIISQGPQVLLDTQLTELGGGLMVNWDCRESSFAPGVLDSMFTAFTALLERVIDDPDGWSAPARVVGQEPLPRRHGGQPVRVVDRLDRDRPDHVPGALVPSEPGWWARADGTGGVELLGAAADRVVRHGVSVGPVEVRDAVLTDRRIREAAVVPEDGTLVAAVVAAEGAGPDLASTGLRADLLRTVPAHLVPTHLAVVARIPRDAAGAADGEAVRQLVAADRARADAPALPRTDLEKVVAGVWADVLGLDEVGMNDEFLALGGDSVLAARVIARLQRDLDTRSISLRSLLRAPTVAGLVEYLRQADDIGQIDEVAAIAWEIRSLSDEEVAAQLRGSS